ncbi:MAG: hypothetical protein KDE59_23480, partial [Anaerolineales bacterium]|nr:hypothetical protein [Anaerolineales bacterium]
MLESLSAIPQTPLADLELFLLNLRYKEGRLVNVEGHRPQLLDDEAQVWVVYAGVVDLFAVPVQEGAVSGTRRHLFQAVPGQALFGLSSAENGFGLLASGSSGTQLLRIPRQRFWALAAELEFSAHIEAMIDNWVLQLTRALARRVPPKPDLLLNSVKPRILDAGEIVSTNEAVLWTQIRFGEATYFCQPELAFDHTAGNLPLTRFSWLASRLRTQLLTSDTAALLDSQEIEAALSYFHSRVKLIMGSNWQQDTAEELDRLQARAAAEQQTMEQALTRLRQPLAARATVPPPDASQTDQLMAALKPIGAALGLNFHPPHLTPAAATPAYEILEQIVRQSDVRTREVALRGAWWRQDGGPLLALTAAENRPVALIYQGRGYQIFDPLTHEYRPVDLTASVQLGPLAYSFYRPFPNSAVTLRDILRFSLQGNRDSFRLNLVVGALIALLGLLPPIATGLVFDHLIPEAQVNLLLQMGLGLLATALAMAILRTVRSLSLIRLLTQVDSSLQAATWDRLLKLPLTFFKEYTAGNLGSRAMGFAQINRIISGHVITTILTGLFSIFNLLLLFYYSPTL